jgi:hypothetical protein
MALIYSVGLLTDLLLQSQNTNKTHIIPDQFLFGSSSGGQSHSHSLKLLMHQMVRMDVGKGIKKGLKVITHLWG